MSDEQQLDDPSWMAWPLRRLTAWIVARPWATLAGVLVVTALALLVTVTGLKFKMSRLDLLNPKSEYNQRWLAYLKEFGDQDDAVVVVQGEETSDVLAALDDLALELKRPDQPFESVLSEWDLSSFRSKGLHFLPREDVLKLDQQLARLKPLLAAPASGPADAVHGLKGLNDQLESINRLTAQQAEYAEREYGRVLAGLAQALPSGGLAAEAIAFDLAGGVEQLEEGLEPFKSHHLLMNDGQTGVVLLRLKEQPGEATKGASAIAHLRELIDSLRPRHARVQMGLTGMPILEYDEMAASQGDMARSTWLSFVCVLVFFWASFGSWRHTLLSNLTLLIGMAWSFGYLTLVVGHLNILSVAFAAIVIGIGIDFSIHYVSHYLNYRARGMASGKALIETATYVGPGVVTGAITTALAFFTAAFTEFVGIVELGIIAGGGIVLCLIATVIALPAMIELADRQRTDRVTNEILNVSAWLWPAKHFPQATLLAGVIATVLICFGLKDLRYDHNLLNLQPNHLESVEIERDVLSSKDQSFWCALAMADDPTHALELKQQFESLETVSRVEEVASLLPVEDDAVRSAIVRVGALLSKVPANLPAALDARPLDTELARAQAFAVNSDKQQLAIQIEMFRRKLQTAAAGQVAVADQWAQNLPGLRSLQSLSDPEAPRLSDLSPPIVDRYVGRSGKFLLRVYAKGNIWDMDALKRFVADVETVDPHVTGHPVQTFYASRHMQKSYLQAALYSLLCVVGTLLLDYRSVKHTLLAMLPLVFGVLQMLGIMGLLGIPFNPANMIALPLILGMGVEEGVHLTHEFRRQKGRFQLGNSTAMAVMLTSATTIAGFACMIISRHQGLRSLGQILTFGMATCLVVSLYGFFALLRCMTWQRPDLADEADDVLTPSSDDDATPVAAVSDNYAEEPIRPLIRPTRTRAVLSQRSGERAA
jgi:hopanoid biosynthesis associated RND transporter like protein HpnN